MDIVETVARAMYCAEEGIDPIAARIHVDSYFAADEGHYGNDYRTMARAAVRALRDTTLVYRNGDEVVHELRGAPDDIWKTLLDAALTSPLPLVGE